MGGGGGRWWGRKGGATRGPAAGLARAQEGARRAAARRSSGLLPCAALLPPPPHDTMPRVPTTLAPVQQQQQLPPVRETTRSHLKRLRGGRRPQRVRIGARGASRDAQACARQAPRRPRTSIISHEPSSSVLHGCILKSTLSPLCVKIWVGRRRSARASQRSRATTRGPSAADTWKECSAAAGSAKSGPPDSGGSVPRRRRPPALPPSPPPRAREATNTLPLR